MSTARIRLAVAAAALCLVAGRHQVGPLPTVPCVDLSRYAGTWHDIARLPNVFQRSCVCSQARYLGFDVDRLITR